MLQQQEDYKERIAGACLDAPQEAKYDWRKELSPRDPLVPVSPAAVLVGIMEREGAPHILLTRRAAHLKAHAGEVAFPGGRVETHDASIAAAALREADEEIGLAPQAVELAGYLPGFVTGTGFWLQPVVGFVAHDFKPLPDHSEVAQVFSVPLAFLMDVRNHKRHRITLPPNTKGERKVRHYYAMTYNEHYIWGATAAVLRDLARKAYPSGANS